MAHRGLREGDCPSENPLCLGAERNPTNVLDKHLCLSFHLFLVYNFKLFLKIHLFIIKIIYMHCKLIIFLIQSYSKDLMIIYQVIRVF